MHYVKGLRVVMAEPFPNVQVLEPPVGGMSGDALAGRFNDVVDGEFDQSALEAIDADPNTPDSATVDAALSDEAAEAALPSDDMYVGEELASQAYAAPENQEPSKKGGRMLGFKLGLMNIGFAAAGVSMKGVSREKLDKIKDAHGLHRFMLEMGAQPVHTLLLLSRLGGTVHGGMGMEHMDHLAATTAATHTVMHATVTPPAGVHGLETPNVDHAVLADHLESNQTSTATTADHLTAQQAPAAAHSAPVEGVSGNLNHAPTEWVSNSDQYNLHVTPGANGSDRISITMSHYHGHQPLFAVVTGKNGQEVKIPLTEHAGPDGTRIYSADIAKSHMASVLNSEGYDKIAIDPGDSSDKKVTTFSTAFGHDTKNVEASANGGGGSGSAGNGGNGGEGVSAPLNGGGGSGHHGLDVFHHAPYHGHNEYDVNYNGGEADVILPKGDTTPVNWNLPHFNIEHGGHSIARLPASDFNSLHTGGHSLAGNIAEINNYFHKKNIDLKMVKDKDGVYEIVTSKHKGLPIGGGESNPSLNWDTLLEVLIAAGAIVGIASLIKWGPDAYRKARRRRGGSGHGSGGHGHATHVGHTPPGGGSPAPHGTGPAAHPVAAPMSVIRRRPAPVVPVVPVADPAPARPDSGDAAPSPYDDDLNRDGGGYPYDNEPYGPDAGYGAPDAYPGDPDWAPAGYGSDADPADADYGTPPEAAPQPWAAWEDREPVAGGPDDRAAPAAERAGLPSMPIRRPVIGADDPEEAEHHNEPGLPLPPQPGDPDYDFHDGPDGPPPDAPGTPGGEIPPEPTPNTSR